MSVELYKEWWRAKPAQSGQQLAAAPGVLVSGSAISRDSAIPFCGLMAFTFILLLAPQSVYPVLAPLRIAMLTGAMAVLTHVATRLSRGIPLIRMSEGIPYLLLLVGWAVMTVPVSYWPGGSVSFLLGDFFKTLIVFFLLANVVNTLQRLRIVSWGLVLMSLPLAFTTVQNFAASETGARIIGYMAPLTGNPNDMALMLNLILPFAIALFLSSRSVRVRLFLGCVVGLLVAAIIATFSRGGFLTLSVIFFSYLWLLRKRPERIWCPLVLVLVVAALPFLPANYTDRISTITDVESDETGSSQERLRDIIAASGFVIQHPVVGAGIGNNIFAMNEARGPEWLEIHNVYLQYAVELGVPGLILFLLFYRACFRHTRRVIRASARTPGLDSLYFIAEALRVCLLAFAVAAIFHPVAYHFYFYYIAGLAIALTGICEAETKRTLESGHGHRQGD